MDLDTSFRLDTSLIFSKVHGLGLEYLNLGHLIDTLSYLATPLLKISVDQ